MRCRTSVKIVPLFGNQTVLEKQELVLCFRNAANIERSPEATCSLVYAYLQYPSPYWRLVVAAEGRTKVNSCPSFDVRLFGSYAVLRKWKGNCGSTVRCPGGSETR